MNASELNIRSIMHWAMVCFLATVGGQVAQAQGTPTSGAMLTISGNVGAAPVNVTIYDSQIHSGLVQAVPVGTGTSNCKPTDATFPTDAYVLQGGSWTGCDTGDAFEVTDDLNGNTSGVAHQAAGKADISGFHIETHYVCSGSCSGFPPVDFSAYCNTSGTICTTAGGADSGFLTVTNNNASNFTGTITLQGKSNVVGGSWCPANGMAFDTWTTGVVGTSNEGTNSVRLALSPDSSNCGGFNAAQTQTLTAGSPSSFHFGNDAYTITPFNSNPGDRLTLLPVPAPAGPLSNEGTTFGSESLAVIPTSPFSATNYPGQDCIPLSDFSALGNPVCPEIQLACTPGEEEEANDCPTFLYGAEIDFSIDKNSLPNGVGGVGFLGDSTFAPKCPSTSFTTDVILSYTATTPDPIRVSDNPFGCFAATFDPTVAPVPVGTTISIFTGFRSPVVNTPPGSNKLNLIKAGRAVPLKWQQSLNTGAPNTNLSWCQTGPTPLNPAVCQDSGPSVAAPWVFLSRIPLVCPNKVDNITTDIPIDPNNSGFQNFGNGSYQFNWQTSSSDTGCTTVVLQFDTGLSVEPANFQFTH